MAVESPDVGRLQPVRPPLKRVAVWMTIGALVGAFLGVLLAGARQQTFRASAVISVAPSSQIFQDAPSQEGDSTALVQSEIIILSGPELRRDVQQRASGDEPVRYTAAQVGSSTIVNIDAEATTAERALATAQAVVAAYSGNRQGRLRGEIERAARIVDAELARLERALASETLGAAALQQEYGRLLAVRSGLFRATANVDRAVTVVQPPVVSGSGLPPLVRDAALAALLGALAGGILLMAANQLSGRVRSRDDLSASGVTVLHPDLDFHAGPMLDFLGPSPGAAALRLLVAQLVRPGGGGGLVLFGATPGVGTSFVAATMAVCLSERSDVLLVLASDVVEQRDGSAAQELGVDEGPRGLTTLPRGPLTADDVREHMLDGAVNGVYVLAKGPGPSGAAVLRRLWEQDLLEACLATGLTVVVDAPALSESTTTIDLASRAGGAAFVIGRNVTTRREVESVRQMFARQEIRLLGAVVNRPERHTGSPLPAQGPTGQEGERRDGRRTAPTAASSTFAKARRESVPVTERTARAMDRLRSRTPP